MSVVRVMSQELTGVPARETNETEELRSASTSLAELARLGADARGGVTRVAWSAGLFDAYEWAAERMRTLDLEVEIDPAGNLIGRWPAGPPRSSAVLVGSHLDTVPSGGRFDGVLGVVAAIHAVGWMVRSA